MAAAQRPLVRSVALLPDGSLLFSLGSRPQGTIDRASRRAPSFFSFSYAPIALATSLHPLSLRCTVPPPERGALRRPATATAAAAAAAAATATATATTAAPGHAVKESSPLRGHPAYHRERTCRGRRFADRRYYRRSFALAEPNGSANGRRPSSSRCPSSLWYSSFASSDGGGHERGLRPAHAWAALPRGRTCIASQRWTHSTLARQGTHSAQGGHTLVGRAEAEEPPPPARAPDKRLRAQRVGRGSETAAAAEETQRYHLLRVSCASSPLPRARSFAGYRARMLHRRRIDHCCGGRSATARSCPLCKLDPLAATREMNTV